MNLSSPKKEISPFNAWQIFRGCVTFPLRMQRINESTLKIAQWLEKRQSVIFVSYPGMESSPCHELAKKQMTKGYKAIGFALRNAIPLGECIVYSSGRIPTDMVMKALRAGIPVLASKAAPTEQASLLAQEYGLTLVCSARRDSMRQYTGRNSKRMQHDWLCRFRGKICKNFS
ncbi:MAG: formate dehydrogenase accessory sulfurtransferase FdhD [Eubacteriales bacterium]|nr:formate dehydrogenase accessory sulfurtransferase FdhD [Eubacteriales bacterium]